MKPADANAPAATAIQMRSKTIQSPQGYVSERCVLPPRPRMNRATKDTAPSAMIARRIWLNGVRSFPGSVSNSGWWS